MRARAHTHTRTHTHTHRLPVPSRQRSCDMYYNAHTQRERERDRLRQRERHTPTHTLPAKPEARLGVSLYKIVFYFNAFSYEPILFFVNTPFVAAPLPLFIAHSIAQCKVSPRLPCIAMHHTILVRAISCKGQVGGVELSPRPGVYGGVHQVYLSSYVSHSPSLSLYMHIYIFIYRSIDREREREGGRERGGEGGREGGRETLYIYIYISARFLR